MRFCDDCIHYLGFRPCRHGRLCDGCQDYEPAGGQVLIIKTAAAGDVLRTTTLLPGLAREKPGALVTWLTAPASAPLLEGNPFLHGVLPFDAFACPALAPREFDLIISLDKEPGPSGLAMILKAKEKRGVGMGAYGKPMPLNPDADGYIALGLSNEIKFRQNKKTYHELIAEAVGVPYSGEEPILNLTEEEKLYGREALERSGWAGAKPVVGINTGSGTAFANKMLGAVALLDVIDGISRAAPGAFIALLGGPLEREKNRHIAHASGGRAADTGCGHPVRGFAGIVSHCGVLLTGDTLAMHIAVALRCNVVALFGPTCAREIDLFGRGVKIVSPAECAPCYLGKCDRPRNCMDALDLKEVASAVAAFVK